MKDEEKIRTLAHELRHAWQYKNKEYKFKIPNTNFQKFMGNVIYWVSEKELDAHKYAKYYCRDNCKKDMLKILGNIYTIYFVRIMYFVFIVPLMLLTLAYVIVHIVQYLKAA
ncbi:hypothetical protein AEA09_07315 [Lysinibacillus contaminans]|uniref:Uncharacterized protein n=1 Tax=Lysinibacillus contaminans TaxID=1293441 RepID=A0ABR5K0F0_9BACI|nr:hypothetical protein AEA09_07315 [Lysinibacillus contaminans]